MNDEKRTCIIRVALRYKRVNSHFAHSLDYKIDSILLAALMTFLA